jgi:hypothetical protein
MNMAEQKIKETIVYRKEVVLKDTSADYLEEHEYMFSKEVFDHAGNKIYDAHYDDTGKVIQEICFYYNDKRLLIEEKIMDGDGCMEEHKKFEYDQNDKLIKEFHYYMDDTFDTVKTFHDGNNVVRKEVYDFDNELERTEQYYYEDGMLIKMEVKDQELTFRKEIRYDTKKLPVEIVEYDAIENSTIKTINEYYPSGNKKAVQVFNENDELVERTILTENEKGHIVKVVEENSSKKNTITMEYDDQGNVLLHHEYDRYGELVNKVQREYNDKNMLSCSKVFMNGAGKNFSRNYELRQDYVFFS